MAQPAAKRRNPTATKIADSDWECHQVTLKDLYISQGLTVSAVRDFMLATHDFPANEQQYQKKFKAWKFTKNISPANWMALSRALKQNRITLEDLDPLTGTLYVTFDGQILAFSKVQKALYRYDTSLLKHDTSLADLTNFEASHKILPSIIIQYSINDRDHLFSAKLPRHLKLLLLKLVLPKFFSCNLATPCCWDLRRRSTDRPIMVLNGDKVATMSSCIALTLDKGGTTLLQSFRSCTASNELQSHLTSFLASQAAQNQTWHQLLPNISAQLKESAQQEILTMMIIVICCIAILPGMAPGILIPSGIVDDLITHNPWPEPIRDTLLEMVLLSMVNQGKSTVCAQLLASGVSPNASGPLLTHDTEQFTTFTALQICLGAFKSDGCIFKPEILAMLLKAGANPNLCGCHGLAKPDHSCCCDKLPFFLALNHPSATLRNLLRAGSWEPDFSDLETIIRGLEHADMLLVLVEEGVLPQFLVSDSSATTYVCLFQAVIRWGKRELIAEVLHTIEGPLGCATTTLQPSVDKRFESWLSRAGKSQSLDYRSPFTFAVLRGFFDVADELLRGGADPNKTYYDYLDPFFLLQIPGVWDDINMERAVNIGLTNPLQAVIRRGDLDAAEYLLKAGADPSFSPPFGDCALAAAVSKGSKDLITLLLEYGAEFTDRNTIHRHPVTRPKLPDVNSQLGPKGTLERHMRREYVNMMEAKPYER